MPSLPPEPRNADPRDGAEYRFRTNGTACEWAESYHPGGYHPVHLGDIFKDRYRVIRKLGYGEDSTVWLAVDDACKSFVAMKIEISNLDKEDVRKEVELYQTLAEPGRRSRSDCIMKLQDYFEHEGPNGHHPCFVIEPMGPNVNAMLKLCPEFQVGEPWERRFTKTFAKRVLRDTLLGLESLHSEGIIHGDLHPGNILMNIRPIEASENSIQSLEQLPSQGSPVKRLDGMNDPWAPSYLLQPESLYEYTSMDTNPLVKITDLGAVFFEDHPPASTVTPVALRAPEIILGLPFGRGIDIWCFGCLIFELLTGQQLFVRLEPLEGDEFDEETNDEHLIQFVEVLGPLPVTLSKQWRRGDKYFGPDGKRLQPANEEEEGEGEGDSGEDLPDAESLPSDASSSSVPLALADTFDPLEKQFGDEKIAEIEPSEEREIIDLLRWVLQYDVEKRPSATEILGHPWFKL
ncbi:SKY1-Protein serine kinase [Pleurostoma richardsiae]|uniref:non-specific serine/threonine protein kinase n=1 Tax=Pleurostoma richardsiae TaxID=41990 RepID=A0AA38RZB2_9PEZI|nr:SKY1-Protein serine kinase [Pleurostoma richardsiae]